MTVRRFLGLHLAWGAAVAGPHGFCRVGSQIGNWRKLLLKPASKAAKSVPSIAAAWVGK